MRRLPPAEAHLDFDFVPIFEESPRGTHSHLQVMVIGARPQPHLFDLRNVLILF